MCPSNTDSAVKQLAVHAMLLCDARRGTLLLGQMSLSVIY